MRRCPVRSSLKASQTQRPRLIAPKRSFHASRSQRHSHYYADIYSELEYHVPETSYFPYNVEAYLSQLECDLRETEKRAQQYEKELSKANTLLYKHANKINISSVDLFEQNELLESHKQHLLENGSMDIVKRKHLIECVKETNRLKDEMEKIIGLTGEALAKERLEELNGKYLHLKKMTDMEIMDRKNF